MSRLLCLFSGDVSVNLIDDYRHRGYQVVVGENIISKWANSQGHNSVLHWDAYEGNYTEDLMAAARMVKNLGQMSLDTGESLSASLEFEGVSLWKVLASELTLYYFHKVIQQVRIVNHLIDRESPLEVVVDGMQSLSAQTLLQACIHRGIPFRCLNRSAIFQVLLPLRTKVRTVLRDCRDLFFEFSSSLFRRKDPTRGMQGRSVLCLNFVDRQSDALWPVLDVLRKKVSGPLYFVIGRHSKLTTKLKFLNIPSWVFESSDAYCYASKIFAWKRKIQNVFISISKHPFEFEGVAINPLLEVGWQRLFLEVFPKYVIHALRSLSILETLKPSLILTTDVNHGIVKLICAMASRLKIPSLNIQYGLVTTGAVEWLFFSQTCTTVFGEGSVSQLKRWGVSDHVMVPCGATRYDRIKETLRSRSQIKTELGLDPDQKLVVFFSVPFYETEIGHPDGRLNKVQHSRLLRLIASIPAQDPLVQVIIRPHPEEPLNLFRCLSDHHLQLRNPVQINTTQTSIELLHACDVAVTCHSTTGIEAILLEKPLISVKFSSGEEPFPFIADGGAQGAHTEDQFFLSLRKLLVDSDERRRLAVTQKAFTKKHFLAIDGKASNRVADLVSRMINSNCFGKDGGC